MNRGQRLQARFNTVQLTIAELHGKEMAYAAACAAWLSAAQYGQLAALSRVARFVTDPVAKVAVQDEILRLNEENDLILDSFHQNLCNYLNVDHAQALELSTSFEQILRDICLQGG